MSVADTWLGWDLGGANLKVVQLDASGRPRTLVQEPCPLWQGLDRLQAALDRALERLGRRGTWHAVTMTGELADLFEDRAEGVRALTATLCAHFPGERVLLYAGAAGFLPPESAANAVDRIASANWLASASLAARRLPSGLLVDIGSTTSDLVPFADGRVLARGATDHARLIQGELVYSGVTRTPVMALTRAVPCGGKWVTLMAEHFATTADIHRLTGELPAHADLLPSADGREKTAQASARRLARMVGLDLAAADAADWVRLAHYLAEVQLRHLLDACACLLSRGELPADAPLVGAGVGRFLTQRLAERLDRPYHGFASLFGADLTAVPDLADCAPAAAVACLAAETCPT